MVRIGVVGCGYWGPKLARNFFEIEESQLAWVVDLQADRLAHMQTLYPTARMSQDFVELLRSDVEGVVLATPVSSHHVMGKQALLAGKHVLIEKPLAATVQEAEELVELAERQNLILMVGHTFVYNPAVEAVRKVIKSGELGEIYYINATRANLGLFQTDINVVWDLAPHDISILNHILDARPESVSARGGVYVQRSRGIHDVAYLTLHYPNRIMAEVRVSWLDPVKTRRYTIVGSKKMLVYDDIAHAKVVIYDKGVDIPPYSDTFAEFHLSYRHGSEEAYPVIWTEPLRNECADFIRSIQSGRNPMADGRAGLEVVKVLEKAQCSLFDNGKIFEVF